MVVTPFAVASLASTMTDLLADPKRTRRIADNSWRDLRGKYLTPATTSCYWRELLWGYKGTMRFEVGLEGTRFHTRASCKWYDFLGVSQIRRGKEAVHGIVCTG